MTELFNVQDPMSEGIFYGIRHESGETFGILTKGP